VRYPWRMPLFKDTVADGNAFDGTANAGLFDITQTGAPKIQPKLRSVNFHTEGSAVAFALYKQDPAVAGNKILVLSGTDTDFAIEGGALILPVDANGNAWALKLETANMSGGDGYFSIDFDYVDTEG